MEGLLFAQKDRRGRMNTAEERVLVEQAKYDPEAFGLLYQRYVTRIYNYHYRHTGNVHDAEDLTSRTFYRALRSIESYQDRGYSFQAWLFRIAHNLVVNLYRDRDRRPSVSLEDVRPADLHDLGFHYEFTALDDKRALARALDALPEERKTLILLKFVAQMSNVEIAAVLGKSEGAVKALYHRTLISLRRKISEEDAHETKN